MNIFIFWSFINLCTNAAIKRLAFAEGIELCLAADSSVGLWLSECCGWQKLEPPLPAGLWAQPRAGGSSESWGQVPPAKDTQNFVPQCHHPLLAPLSGSLGAVDHSAAVSDRDGWQDGQWWPGGAGQTQCCTRECVPAMPGARTVQETLLPLQGNIPAFPSSFRFASFGLNNNRKQ